MSAVLRLTPAGRNLLDEMGEEAGYLEKPAVKILLAIEANPEDLSRESLLRSDPSNENRKAIDFLRQEGYLWTDTTI